MKIKRILCLILVLATAFSVLVIPNFTALAANNYTNAYGLMNALGVLRGESNPAARVTRRDLAVYIRRITNAEGGSCDFADVAADDAERQVFAAVAQNGYMMGSEGYFYPDRQLTKNEAITALLRVAGYNDAAERSGGYISGYSKWAAKTNLLRNVDSTDSLTHGALTQMLYNLMQVNMFVVDSYTSSGNTTQRISDSDTVLKKYFDCIKWRGRVVATSDASIWQRDCCSDGKVVINCDGQDYLYAAESFGFDSKLGMQADFYTKYGEEDIVYCEYLDSQYEVKSFSGDDILNTDRAISFIEYTDKNNKKQTADTSKASFVYNGRNYSGITLSDMQADYSLIECCDVNSDGSADVVYVWSYDVIMVDSINFANHKITDKISGKIIDFDPDECDITVRMDGADYDLSDIAEYYTLLVAEADINGKKRKLTIEVFPDMIDGKLTGKSGGGSKSITVNSETYAVRSSFDTDSLKLNEEYIFGIDFDGNALCVLEKNFWHQRYGFALNMATENAIDKKVIIRLFTENNRLEDLTFAKKFKLNGSTATWSDLQASALFDGGFKEQLVSYKLNAEGLISQINVSDGTEAAPSENGDSSLKLNKRISKNDTSVYYRLYNNVGQFGEYISANGITKNFYIYKSGDEFVEEEFFVGTPSDMRLDKGYADIDIYDATYERVAGAAVYYITDDILKNEESDIYGFAVSKVRNAKNKDGDDVIRLTGFYQGKEMTLEETETLKFASVRPGDILMTWGIDGRLALYKKMFSVDEATFGNEYIGYDSDSDEFDPGNRDNPLKSRVTGYYAEILSRSSADRSIFLTKTRGGKIRPISVASFTNYYVYDTAEKTLSFGTKDDLDVSCKNVYFVNTYGIPRDVIIYK